MNLSISRILPSIHYEQGVKWGIKKSIRHTLTGIPAHQSLHPIVNSGLETNKTQRHATYFRERTKWLNWQMIQPRPLPGLTVHISAGRGRAVNYSWSQKPLIAICEIQHSVIHANYKLSVVAQHWQHAPNIYLNTGCWYSSSVHPLDDTVHAPARRPASLARTHSSHHLPSLSDPHTGSSFWNIQYLVLLSLTRVMWDKRHRRLSEELAG